MQAIAADGFNTATGAAITSSTDHHNVDDYTTQYTYDALDHVVAVQKGVAVDASGHGNVEVWQGGTATYVNLRQEYTYDADGNRLTSWDGTLASADRTTHVLTKYTYDTAGDLVLAAAPVVSGQASTTAYVYDDFGHLKSQKDALGNTATWSYDYFGARILAHADFGGTTYAYAYDHAGQLTQQTSAGGATGGSQNLSYKYDEAGQMTTQLDQALNKTSSFVYDEAGQHVQETTTQAGIAYQDNHLAYDDRGRLVDSQDASVHVSYAYDAVGNRVHVNIHLMENSALTTSVTNTTIDSNTDQWFAYDGMNRETHVNWDTQSAAGAHGHTLTYDADGNRLTDAFTGNLVNYNVSATVYSTSQGAVTERYSYDADDRMLQGFVNMVTGTTPSQVQIEARLYDGAGHLVQRGSAVDGGFLTAANVTTTGATGLGFTDLQTIAYDDRGEMTSTSGGTSTAPDLEQQYTTVFVHDAAGNVTSTSLTSTSYHEDSGSPTDFSDQTIITLVAGESYEATKKTSTETTKNYDNNGAVNKTVTTTTVAMTTYDPNGGMKSVTDNTASPMIAQHNYVVDLQGHVLYDAYANQEMRALVVDGEEVGQYGVGVTNDNKVQQVWSFGFGYDSLEADTQTSGTTSVVAQSGETLGQLAEASYGDARLWRRIAAANGWAGDVQLQRGERVLMPGVSGQPSNGLRTHAIDDESKMIGKTAPLINAATLPTLGVVGQLYANATGQVPPHWRMLPRTQTLPTVYLNVDSGGGRDDRISDPLPDPFDPPFGTDNYGIGDQDIDPWHSDPHWRDTQFLFDATAGGTAAPSEDDDSDDDDDGSQDAWPMVNWGQIPGADMQSVLDEIGIGPSITSANSGQQFGNAVGSSVAASAESGSSLGATLNDGTPAAAGSTFAQAFATGKAANPLGENAFDYLWPSASDPVDPFSADALSSQIVGDQAWASTVSQQVGRPSWVPGNPSVTVNISQDGPGHVDNDSPQSVYASKYNFVSGHAGTPVVGSLRPALDLPPLDPIYAPTFADGRAGTGKPMYDGVNHLFYDTFDADEVNVGLISAPASPVPEAETAVMMAAGAAWILQKELQSQMPMLKTAAAVTLTAVGIILYETKGDTFEELSPEEKARQSQPLTTPIPPQQGPGILPNPGLSGHERNWLTAPNPLPAETWVLPPLVSPIPDTPSWQDLLVNQLRDPSSGRFVVDPDNPASPYEFTDADRRRAWRDIAQDPNSILTPEQRLEVQERGWRGPQQYNDYDELETMELSHEPIPLREGGTEVVPRWPADHAAVDPYRHLKDRGD